MVGFVNKQMKHSNVLIVDALNVAMRWKPYKPGDPAVSFTRDFIGTIISLARSYDCGQVIVAADMKGSSYRRELFPAYKANRKVAADAQTPEQKKQTEKFFAFYEEALAAIDEKFLLLRYPGVEADDIAAYIVSKKNWYSIDKIWLISSDRDWDLLISEDVSRFSTVTRKEITLDTWDYEVPPESYLCYKCLQGDKGDNIPGVPGVGPKKAASLIETYGSALDIVDAIPIASKYKYIQAVNENRDQILLNHELMDLLTYCEDAIGPANVSDIGRQLMLNERIESDPNR